MEYTTDIFNSLKDSGKYELNMILRKAYEDWTEEHPFDHGFGWASEPWCQEEMPLSKEFIQDVAKESDTAVIVIGRTAGEDQDNKNESGSYLFTDLEKQMVNDVCSVFKNTVVVMNIGNIMDMKWQKEANPNGIILVWKGGQEGGNAVYDVLSGKVNPCGKLTDTIAYNISDYGSTEYFGDKDENLQKEDIYVGYRYFETFAKDRVMYPFGYGMSYTSFEVESVFEKTDNGFKVNTTVTNIGDMAGKEVVQVYVAKPQGKLGNPARELVGYAKTTLLEKGESQMMEITCTNKEICYYDDSGVTGHKSAFVIEEGEYKFYCGTKAFSLQNGTCLASTFNNELIEELYKWEGLELSKNRIDALLGPGMNIHRNPLNGRNFEYFSEDPFLTGKMAVSMLKGMHEYNVEGVIKHFAGNTQELNRHSINSVISERALREIYLRGFEMAVHEGKAKAVMSTYGPVNGIWTS